MERQRIDKWLWHARVVRTRAAAASLVSAGRVRINGMRTVASSRPVRPDDVVTVALDRCVRILRVIGFAERRGAAESAAGLYEDLTPPPAEKAAEPGVGVRAPGEGRPTKRDRREIDRLRKQDGFELD